MALQTHGCVTFIREFGYLQVGPHAEILEAKVQAKKTTLITQ